MKNVKILVGLQPEASVALMQDVDAPAQDVEIRKTIDHKNDPSNDKTWQGFMVFFGSINKVVPVSAGLLLSAAQDAGIENEVFAGNEEEGYELITNHFGIQEGKIVFA